MIGRPSNIDTVIGITDDGHQTTVSERIVQGIRIGGYLEPAIAAAGQSKSTVYGWLKVAGQARIKVAAATAAGLDAEAVELSQFEEQCVIFSDAVDEASALWEMDKLAELERLERGGILVETITEKVDAAGKLIERQTRRTTTLPDANVIQWRLKRRFPERYREQVEVSGTLDTSMSDEERARGIVDSLEAYLKGRAEAVEEALRAAPAKRPARKRAKRAPADRPAE